MLQVCQEGFSMCQETSPITKHEVYIEQPSKLCRSIQFPSRQYVVQPKHYFCNKCVSVVTMTRLVALTMPDNPPFIVTNHTESFWFCPSSNLPQWTVIWSIFARTQNHVRLCPNLEVSRRTVRPRRTNCPPSIGHSLDLCKC